MFHLSETGVLGDFWGRIKGAKYRFAYQVRGNQGEAVIDVPLFCVKWWLLLSSHYIVSVSL